MGCCCDKFWFEEELHADNERADNERVAARRRISDERMMPPELRWPSPRERRRLPRSPSPRLTPSRTPSRSPQPSRSDLPRIKISPPDKKSEARFELKMRELRGYKDGGAGVETPPREEEDKTNPQ